MSQPHNLEENKALMRRWFKEVWNQGRAEAVSELFAEDGVAHGLSDDLNAPLKDQVDFYPFTRSSAKRFPTSKLSSKIRLRKAIAWSRVAPFGANTRAIV